MDGASFSPSRTGEKLDPKKKKKKWRDSETASIRDERQTLTRRRRWGRAGVLKVGHRVQGQRVRVTGSRLGPSSRTPKFPSQDFREERG